MTPDELTARMASDVVRRVQAMGAVQLEAAKALANGDWSGLDRAIDDATGLAAGGSGLEVGGAEGDTPASGR